MKRSMQIAVLVVFVGAFLAPPLWAGTFKASEVSADARWAIHIDVEHLVSSHIGKHFKDLLKMEIGMEDLDEISDRMDMDPFEDIHSVTLYGKSFEEEEGVILVKGRFDLKKVMGMMDEEDVDYGEAEYGEFTIYTVKDAGERFYFSFYKRGAALFSNSKKLIKEALDVLEGERESLADEGKLKGMRSLPEGAFFAAAARGFDDILGLEDEPQAAVLQKAESVMLAAGELEGENFLKATLKASDEKTARQVHDVVKGLIALGSMLQDQAPEMREVAKFLKSVNLSLDGRVVSLYDSYPAEDLIKLLGKVMD